MEARTVSRRRRRIEILVYAIMAGVTATAVAVLIIHYAPLAGPFDAIAAIIVAIGIVAAAGYWADEATDWLSGRR